MNTFTVDQHFIGDYDDAWYWSYADGNRLISSVIRINQAAAKVGDIYMTRSTP